MNIAGTNGEEIEEIAWKKHLPNLQEDSNNEELLIDSVTQSL